MLASEATWNRKTDLVTEPRILSVLFSDANVFTTELVCVFAPLRETGLIATKNHA